jgi:hypothetical protein
MSARITVEREGLFDEQTVLRVRLVGDWCIEATYKIQRRPRQLALGAALHVWEPWGLDRGPMTGIVVRVWVLNVSLSIRAPRTAAQIAEEKAAWDAYDDEEAP